MPHDILIVGDGLTGLTMALALAQKNIPCAIMGPHLKTPVKKAAADGRTTAIMQDGVNFLQTLGVWDSLAPHAAPLKHMRLISGEKQIVFPSADLKMPQFGFNIPNALLKQILLQQVKKKTTITCIDGVADEITFPTDGKNRFVTLNNKIQTSLLIAADGANSKARQAAGITTVNTNSNQAALVCLVRSDKAHNDTSTEWYYSGGPFTLVPTLDPFVMAVVYCDTPEIITESKDLPTDALSDLFADLSQNNFGALDVISVAQSWPITPCHAKQLVAPHLALIGEAAHVMPPLAAQGFNTSLRDIQALQDTIYRAVTLGLDKTALINLRPYEKQRRADITLRSHAVNGLNHVIRRDDTWGRRVHALGFAALDKVAPLKTALMRVALAPRKPERAV